MPILKKRAILRVSALLLGGIPLIPVISAERSVNTEKYLAQSSNFITLDKNPSPADLLALKCSGVAALRSHDYERALSIFQKYLSYNSNDPQGYFWRGVAFQNSGQPDRAIEEYQQSLLSADTGPVDAVELRNNLANLLFQKGRMPEAETHYRRALEIDARAWDVKMNYAQLLLSQNRVEEAAKLLSEATPRLAYEPRFCLLEGVIALKRGDNERAIDWLQKCEANAGQVPSRAENLNGASQQKQENFEVAAHAERILQTLSH